MNTTTRGETAIKVVALMFPGAGLALAALRLAGAR